MTLALARAFGGVVAALIAIGALKQGIALKLRVHEGAELEAGHLQQLDRLLELRRHHQLLALPKLQAGAYGHAVVDSGLRLGGASATVRF